MTYLRPDAKSQFTIEYDDCDRRPLRVHTIVISTQHDEFDEEKAMQEKIKADVLEYLIPELIRELPEQTAEKDPSIEARIEIYYSGLFSKVSDNAVKSIVKLS